MIGYVSFAFSLTTGGMCPTIKTSLKFFVYKLNYKSIEVSIHYEYTEKYYGMKLLLVKLFMLTNIKAQVTNYCDRLVGAKFYFLKIFIGVQLLYNVVLVSTVQQSETAIHIHISPLFWISFLFRSPQGTE